MILLNAPVACADPAHRAVRLAIDLQAAVQSLANRWSDKGYAMGFGVGIAMGPATVGTIGYEGRLDYTAVGSAVNLASRLCDLADDAQILIDPVVAEQVSGDVRVSWLGERTIKGYSRAMRVRVKIRSGSSTRGRGRYSGAPMRPSLTYLSSSSGRMKQLPRQTHSS